MCAGCLSRARAEADERDQLAKQRRATAYSQAAKIFYFNSSFQTPEHIEQVIAMIEAHPGEFETQERLSLEDLLKSCEAAPKQLKILAKRLKKRIRK